ncbi:hypothetical protein AAS21_gp095 [Pantoea phage vB_PagS_AAS21]|uniref:Uncharacterized protein n=1 Tax=Pantoea phage vB_PagS_AAS21 TaxID=2575261 RepID=A0A4Y5P1W7_9CAUD|nr:hypothetical protein AAS21_gp095 [Pantoea phage vB_PagS_AAS21]
MSLEELYRISETLELSFKDKEKINKKFRELEAKFEREARSRIPTAEMLNRLYTL